MNTWFEDESFWKRIYPHLFPAERFALAEEQVDHILTLTVPAGRSVLDLCCGPGRHATLLAQRGFTVTGVDRSPFLLDQAKARAQADHLSVEWIVDDMRHFVRPETYDLVLNMFTSFGYFDDPQEDRQVLQNMYRSLKPHGVCLIDVMGKEVVARTFQPTRSQRSADGMLWVECHNIVDGWRRIHTEWLFIKDGQVTTVRFQLNVYSGQELKERLQQAGFQRVQLFGDLAGNAYGPQASRLVAVANKEP